ncbi:hydroxymethylpyrimidine/phosphomethylpyrimidine kinase [Aquimarina hainanensis]|uniref:hydroxymethylpyrimidine kinase n=1 Tax=Aquimarina hainanensis TaxID=1578017 RepID=A0ABW5N3T4_9FLAO|nr:hydroxymethylpyrimidine/phosphomethylpyrimidine kinase [Aquimarina sp. TRL1]QKX04462.1 hydroxymethylpyrimidine/phosphomethylpyrimidine kinase [Aquimarina sp. TRL1]
MRNRPYVITIAGFDPSGGAGLVADSKTFDHLKCYGLAVCTANTIQDDKCFKCCHWIEKQVIKRQLQTLLERFDIEVVKIGIIEDWELLHEIIDVLTVYNDRIKIVVDPVLRSSTNFDFKKQEEQIEVFNAVLKKITLITPNYDEIEALFPEKDIEETIAYISGRTGLLLKGGHRLEAIGKDELYLPSGEVFTYNPKGKNHSEKHGSGCVLSSAIAAYLARGFSLHKAVYRGKRYTEKVLQSNKSLLGYHG